VLHVVSSDNTAGADGLHGFANNATIHDYFAVDVERFVEELVLGGHVVGEGEGVGYFFAGPEICKGDVNIITGMDFEEFAGHIKENVRFTIYEVRFNDLLRNRLRKVYILLILRAILIA
jgi:hypothetical protein